MGLGRIRDQRFAAVPSGGAGCGVDLQLVELVCPLRGAIPAPGSSDEPTIADVCRRPASEPCGPDNGNPDEYAWRSGAGAGDSDQPESVFERAEEYCGAVERLPVLAADLGENTDAFSSSGSGLSDPLWPGSEIERVSPGKLGGLGSAASGPLDRSDSSGVDSNRRF